MFKPFQVLSSDDSRLDETYSSEFPDCWVLVETHPNGKVARVIANDGGEPEDQNLVRDFSWVPDILNEYYLNYKIELQALQEEISLLKKQLENKNK